MEPQILRSVMSLTEPLEIGII